MPIVYWTLGVSSKEARPYWTPGKAATSFPIRAANNYPIFAMTGGNQSMGKFLLLLKSLGHCHRNRINTES